jgi:uncharacterized membrane protein YczE
MKELNYKRIGIYLLGLLILGCGIDFNTKTQLGVSPIISVAYNIAYLTHIPIGVMTFIYYVLLVIIQWILLGKKFDYFQFLQIPASLVTSFFIQLFDGVILVASRLMMLILAIVITGIGASLTVGMKIVPNPADGLASVVGEKCHKGFGFGKNFFDGISIVISLIIGFVFTGGILGIGLGTVISMIFTGRVIALLETSISRLYFSVTEIEFAE